MKSLLELVPLEQCQGQGAAQELVAIELDRVRTGADPGQLGRIEESHRPDYGPTKDWPTSVGSTRPARELR